VPAMQNEPIQEWARGAVRALLVRALLTVAMDFALRARIEAQR